MARVVLLVGIDQILCSDWSCALAVVERDWTYPAELLHVQATKSNPPD